MNFRDNEIIRNMKKYSTIYAENSQPLTTWYTEVHAILKKTTCKS